MLDFSNCGFADYTLTVYDTQMSVKMSKKFEKVLVKESDNMIALIDEKNQLVFSISTARATVVLEQAQQARPTGMAGFRR